MFPSNKLIIIIGFGLGLKFGGSGNQWLIIIIMVEQ